jgi:hypothetical protein
MISEKDIKELNDKADQVLEILDDLPYFESSMVLEIVRDTLRMFWMADVANISKKEK